MHASDQKIGFGTLTYYFLPLAFQAASQSLTYPLVAIVAAHAEGGALNVAGLAAGNNVTAIMGMLGCGLITTGMVFIKDKESLNAFRKLSNMLAIIVCLLQAMLIIPIFSHFVFGKLLNLNPLVEDAACKFAIVAIPLQYIFFVRNQYTVVLYTKKQTMKASIPSIVRIILTAIFAKIFVMLDLVGTGWAAVCLTLPVAIETIIYQYYAKPFINELVNSNQTPPKKLEMFFFNLPISISSVMIFFSTFIMAAFITRTENGNNMYAVYVLALGLVNPMSFAATKIQTIVLMFAEETKGRMILPVYAMIAGLFLGSLPLLFTLPLLGNFYYVEIQNLPIDNMPLIRETAFILILVPVAVALRAYSEGLAALNKKTTIFMAGQGLYLASAAVIGFFSLHLGLPGHLIGGIGLISANLISSGTMRLTIFMDTFRNPNQEPVKSNIGPMDPI